MVRLVIGLAMLCSVAHAADDDAKRHFERGTKSYNLQAFQAALYEFSAAYNAKPDAALLFNIGQCQRQLGQYVAANRSYRAYLLNSKDLSEDTRKAVGDLARQMDDAAREERAQRPPEGTIATGSAITARPTPPAPRPWFRNPASITLTAVGIIGVAVGGTLLGLAANEGTLAARSTTDSDFTAHHENDLDFQRGGWPVLAIGATSLVVGGVVIAIDLRRKGR